MNISRVHHFFSFCWSTTPLLLTPIVSEQFDLEEPSIGVMNFRPQIYRRGGRAVDRAGLENRRAERPREFESHPLRQTHRFTRQNARFDALINTSVAASSPRTISGPRSVCSCSDRL